MTWGAEKIISLEEHDAFSLAALDELIAQTIFAVSLLISVPRGQGEPGTVSSVGPKMERGHAPIILSDVGEITVRRIGHEFENLQP